MTLELLSDWILQTSFAVSVLILFVLIVRKPVARLLGAKAAYALWSLPLIRLIMPEIPVPSFLSFGLSGSPESTAPISPAMVYPSELGAIASPAQQTLTPINWELYLVGLWLFGACVYMAAQIYRQRLYRLSLESNSQEAGDGLRKLTKKLSDSLEFRHPPEVRLSVRQDGPLVTGLLKPVIILPRGFEENYSAQQQELTLVHELSHLCRQDLWAAFAALTFRAINWPNPLVHLAGGPFRCDQEAACDQTVLMHLGNDRAIKTTYAETLIHAAKLAGISAKPTPLGLTIFTPLKERLMILKTTQKKNTPLRMAASVLAIGALMATAPYTMAGPDSSHEQHVEKKVMKWSSDDSDTMRHVEITTENGVTTAFEIDEFGNKKQVDLETLDMPDIPMPPGIPGEHKMRVIMKNGDGDMSGVDLEKIIGLAGEFAADLDFTDEDGNKRVFVINKSGEMNMDHDGNHRIIMKSINDGKGTTINFSNDEEFEVHTEGSGSAKMMVGVAADMMKNVDTDDMDRNTRRKVEDAQKALQEAMEALEDE